MFRSRTIAIGTLNLPMPVAVVLVLIAVALQVLNQVTFDLSKQWHALVLIALVILPGMGISPSLGPQVRAWLHMPTWLATLISVGLSAAALALTFLPIANVWHAVIVALITFFAGLGFAPAVIPTVSTIAGEMAATPGSGPTSLP